MEMTVLKEVHTPETGGAAHHAGPVGKDQGCSGVVRRRGRAGPEPSLGFSQESTGEAR